MGACPLRRELENEQVLLKQNQPLSQRLGHVTLPSETDRIDKMVGGDRKCWLAATSVRSAVKVGKMTVFRM